jgi:3-hydroxy-9,10-secoandrosta-1,3,5(10)-triene-9,17-dione monooxygenase reductase component
VSESIDPAHFRAVMGYVPTSVVVVTGFDAAGEAHGITIGSFVSVSLQPALVGFFPALDSVTWSAIEPSGTFCVNVLRSDQADLCWQFAKEAEHRFQGVKWSPAPNGSPIIDGCLAWIDCSVHSVTEIGDHYFVVGDVLHMAHADEEPKDTNTVSKEADAMVFFRGKVSGVGSDS